MKEATHLRLEGIREAIESLSGPELAAEVARLELWSGSPDPREPAIEAASPTVEAAGAGSPPVEALMCTMQAKLEAEPPAVEEPQGSPPISEAVRPSMPLRLSPGALYQKIMKREPKTPLAPDTWTRIHITDDLEIHFRPGAGRRFQKKLGKLIAMATKSFSK